MDGNLKDLRAISDVVPLSILKLLDISDKAKLVAASGRYLILREGVIESIWYQKKIVKEACRKASGSYAYQLPPGSGKTYPSAEISAKFQKRGKTVYICPNVAAMGDESSGIIQKFHRMYKKLGVEARIGRVNETSKTNDVHFFTPAAFVGLQKLQKSLFDQILSEAAILIVDEAHHFPLENDGAHKVFGEIEKIAQMHFLAKKKKLVAFTATYGRLDGRPPIIPKPDFMLTVQDMVNEGRCPEIHGQQIFLPFKCPKAHGANQDYDLGLEGQEYEDYWRTIAGCMIEIYKRNPAPFAAFVRLQTEAVYLVEIFNHSSGLGERGIAVMTAQTPMAERLRIIEKINKGLLVGYVTCGVGEEAIDIPKIEVIHFIKRTQSVNKLVQAVGRGLRMYPGKRRTLFVDYQVMKGSVIRACNGIFLYATACGLDPEKVKNRPNGGALVAIEGAQSAIIPGAETFGQVEALVWKKIQLESDPVMQGKEILFRLAQAGEPRPTDKSVGEYENVRLNYLGALFYRIKNSKSKNHDSEFLARIAKLPNLHPSWAVFLRDRMKEREEELLRMARAGEPKPKWNGGNNPLAYSLQAWTNKADPKYKPEFDKKIREAAPQWFLSEYQQVPEIPPEVKARERENDRQRKRKWEALPEDHWLKTGKFFDAGQSSGSSGRQTVQKVILQALKNGPLPSLEVIQGPESYSKNPDYWFVQEDYPYKEHGVAAWQYGTLISGIESYTDRHSRGWGKKYHLDFSFHMKLRYPDCPYITPLYRARSKHWEVPAGLSPWEKWLKAKELAFTKEIDLLSEAEQRQRVIAFCLMDPEFANTADDYSYQNDVYEFGEYGIFEREDQAILVRDIIGSLPRDLISRRSTSDRGLNENCLETLIIHFYRMISGWSKETQEKCGGFSAIEGSLCEILSFGEMKQSSGIFREVEFFKRHAVKILPAIKRCMDMIREAMTAGAEDLNYLNAELWNLRHSAL